MAACLKKRTRHPPQADRARRWPRLRRTRDRQNRTDKHLGRKTGLSGLSELGKEAGGSSGIPLLHEPCSGIGERHEQPRNRITRGTVVTVPPVPSGAVTNTERRGNLFRIGKAVAQVLRKGWGKPQLEVRTAPRGQIQHVSRTLDRNVGPGHRTRCWRSVRTTTRINRGTQCRHHITPTQ